MKADDLVDLIVVTPHSFLSDCGVTRQYASNLMRAWFNNREDFASLSWWIRLYRYFRSQLKPKSLASNRHGEVPGTDFAQWVIGAESIIAMYIREREPTVHEKLAMNQERFLKVVEKELNKGEEWREE